MDIKNCMKLNAAPSPYFDGGLVQMNSTGIYYYMCTRNNNFGSRTQKGTIVVAIPQDNTTSNGTTSAATTTATATSTATTTATATSTAPTTVTTGGSTAARTSTGASLTHSTYNM